MAEAVGTALAVVGVLGQLFDGCVRAYGHFATAARFEGDARRLGCKVRIEEMRLLVWGRHWGVAEGRLEARLLREEEEEGGKDGGGGVGGVGGPALRRLALQILTELHQTITDVHRLRDRYGLALGGDGDGGGGGSGGGGDGDGDGDGNDEGGAKKKKWGIASPHGALAVRPAAAAVNGTNNKPAKTGERSWRQELATRTKWVVADKDKFTSLLGDLKDFNDGLEQLFPASRIPGIQRAWMGELLQEAQRDVEQLRALERASDAVYPRLHASAGLKRLRINLDSKPQAAFKPTFAFRVPRPAVTVADGADAHAARRSEGFRGDDAVVIEWVDYDPEDLGLKFVHLRRLDDLARMMHSALDRHPDLHTLDCLGYTDDVARSRYGLVYKAPRPTFSTLHELIAGRDLKTPDLDARVRLARTLAVALWSLHSLDWLHKSLCANNILFFPSAASAAATQPTAGAAVVPDIAAPCLVGFDASRPDLDTDMSVAPRNPSILDLHRHPTSVRRGLSPKPYCKAYDIYSLGLVLLEIGLWKVLQTFHKPHYSAERWRDKTILPVLVPGLGSKTGRLYKNVVERCLTVEDDLTGEEAGQLMEEVVATLERITV